jgi:hypothetical protein
MLQKIPMYFQWPQTTAADSLQQDCNKNGAPRRAEMAKTPVHF